MPSLHPFTFLMFFKSSVYVTVSLIGASLSEPHTSELNGGFSYVYYMYYLSYVFCMFVYAVN